MEALLRELSLTNPGMNSAGSQERVTAFEKMLVDGLNGVDVDDEGAASTSSAQAKMGPVPPPSAASPASEDAFQRSIRQAMDKLKQSDSSLQVHTFSFPMFPISYLRSHIVRCIDGCSRRK